MRSSANGVSKTGMRERNLSALLAAIHYHPGNSRVQLAARLGLSNTTISALVEELMDRGLVESNGAGERVGAGRPSALLWPTTQRVALVVNPEIDVVTMALVSMGGRIVDKVSIPNRGSRAFTVSKMVKLATRYLAEASERTNRQAEVAMLAVPGAVDAQLETVIAAPSLRWKNVKAGAALGEVIGMPVVTVNNARAATVGEWAFGALRDHHSGICIFSGTGGIGGGLLINDAVVAGTGGLAGEIGKMRIDDADLGRSNLSLEQLIQRDAVVAELGYTSLNDEELRSAMLDAIAKRKLAVVAEQSRVLANAIASLRDLLDPEVIVLGGYLGSILEVTGGSLLRAINVGAMVPRADGFLVSRSIGQVDMVLLGAAEAHWVQVLRDPLSSKLTRRRRNPSRGGA